MADDEKPAPKTRTFISVGYPAASIVGKKRDGSWEFGQLYTVYETKLDPEAPNGLVCRSVADAMNAAQVNAYIKEHEHD